MNTMTKEKIEVLTMEDVVAAKARQVEARKTRAGSSTVDYILAQVGGEKTLDMAKKALLAKLT